MAKKKPIERVNLRQFEPVEPLVPGESSSGEPYESWADVKPSQTLLRTHNDCPRAAYLYLKYHGGAASHAMDNGSAFHRFAERAANLLIESDEPQLPYDIGKDLMEHVIETSTDLVIPIGLHDDLRWMAFHWCEGMFLPNPRQTIAGVEVMLELDVPMADGTLRTIRGKADLVLVDGPLCTVWDYKTMFIPGSADYAKQEISGAAGVFSKAYQTRFYAVCAAFGRRAGHPFPIAEHCTEFLCGELYPRHLWDDGIGQIGPVSFGRPELNEERQSIEAQVRQLDERLSTWDFPARDGAHCDECPAEAECPIPSKLRKRDLGVPSAETIEAYATRQFHAERQAADDRKVLKGWFNEHGPIRFGKDLIWESHSSTSNRLRDKDELALAIQRAQQYGEPFELSDHYKSSTSTRFQRRALTPHEVLAEQEEGADYTVPDGPPPDWEPLESDKKAELDRKYGAKAPY